MREQAVPSFAAFILTGSHPRLRPSTGTPTACVERLPARPTIHLLETITGE